MIKFKNESNHMHLTSEKTLSYDNLLRIHLHRKHVIRSQNNLLHSEIQTPLSFD